MKNLLVIPLILIIAIASALYLLNYFENQKNFFLLNQKLPQSGLGQNYIGVVHWLEVTPNGTILPEVMSSTKSTISFINEAHSRGFKVLLILYPEWYDPVAKVPYPHPGEIERGPVPDSEKFMKEMTQVTIEFAKISEGHNVEMFSPTTELNVFLTGGEKGGTYKEGWELTKRWHEETVPKIREVYSGYLVPKGEITWNKYYLDPIGDLSYFDYFSLYDYVAADIFEGDPPIRSVEEYRKYVKRTIGYLQELKNMHNAKGLILGPEIGITPAVEAIKEFSPENVTENMEEKFLEIFFNESVGKVDGLFFWDDWRHPEMSEVIQRYFIEHSIEMKGLDVWV